MKTLSLTVSCFASTSLSHCFSLPFAFLYSKPFWNNYMHCEIIERYFNIFFIEIQLKIKYFGSPNWYTGLPNAWNTWLNLWCHGVMVITTAQLHPIIHSTKPELRFCAGSNSACGMLEICDAEDLWHWSRLEIMLNAFRWSTIPQKQFIIIIIIVQKESHETV